MSITLLDKKIGADYPPFVIAEMSGNHNQSLQRALEIVDAAATAGVHALKLQTYTADTMTLDLAENEFFIHDDASLWKGTSLHKLYQQAYTPWEWHQPIFERCREHGIICFSTPFDETAVDFLESLQVPCYKIASFENTDIPLVRKVAATGKPLIISTGMASAAELDETVRAARDAGCRDMVLLKCSSSYPASPLNSNLLTIPHMRSLFDLEVGISDHTTGIGVAIAAVALGATVIEKHFTLCRADGGVDAAFSLEPEEMRLLVEQTSQAKLSMGKIFYGATQEEQASLIYRRSLYIVEDLSAGELLSAANLRSIRPGLGLPPKYHDLAIGRRVRTAVKKGTPLTWNLLA